MDKVKNKLLLFTNEAVKVCGNSFGGSTLKVTRGLHTASANAVSTFWGTPGSISGLEFGTLTEQITCSSLLLAA